MYITNIRITGCRPGLGGWDARTAHLRIATLSPQDWRDDETSDGLLRSWAWGLWREPREISVRLLGLEVSASW